MRYKISTILIVLATTGNSQDLIRKYSTKYADKLYAEFAYVEAAEKYHIAYKKDTTNSHIKRRLADTYLKLNDTENAEIWLSKSIRSNTDIPEKYYLHYAQVLSKNEKYEASKYWFQRYQELAEDELSQNKITGLSDLDAFYLEAGKYTVESVPYNSRGSDFAPMYYGNGIAFVSTRSKQNWIRNEYNWDGSEFLDMYQFDPEDTLLRISKIEGLNSSYHEGPGQFYDGEKAIVFTRNNVLRNKLTKNEDGVTKLQLFFTQKDTSGNWLEAVPFQHNNKSYSLGHPTISQAGDLLIFSSDMPGGFGNTDLYVSRKNQQGVWSSPQNLGERFNSEGNEMFPYLIDGTLYFASDGREGLGGLDIYFVKWNDPGQPKNLGAPINSSKDDFGLITTAEFRSGYFASNRDGDDDIYTFSADFVKIKGYTLAKSSNESLDGSEVTLLSNEGNLLDKTISDENGVFSFEIADISSFRLIAAKELYKLYDTLDANSFSGQKEIQLKPIYLYQSLLELRVVEEGTDSLLLDATKTLKPLSGGQFLLPFNNENDQYQVEAGSYEVVTALEGFYTARDTIKIESDLIGSKEVIVPMKRIVVGESIRLDHIYYDVNSATLRHESELELDKVVVFMNDNSHIKIELSSHTDSRGSAPYNLSLSQRRAESAANYLIKQGIKEDRIVPKGYGERKIINRCRDGVRCSADEHQENRRTEIKILEND